MISSGIDCPTSCARTSRIEVARVVHGLPRHAAMTSPGVKVRLRSGPPVGDRVHERPRAAASFIAAASSGVRSWTPTPIHARSTWPVFWICSATRRAMFDGDGEADAPRLRAPTIIVLMPSTSPSRSQSGPPELPGLMLASVWR